MKTTDERMRDVLARAQAREAALRRRRQRDVVICGGALVVAVVVVVGVGMASMAGPSVPPPSGTTLGLMGSVVADGSALGYVVVGLLGLVLGVALTVLTYRVGRMPVPKELEAKASGSKSAGHGRSAP